MDYTGLFKTAEDCDARPALACYDSPLIVTFAFIENFIHWRDVPPTIFEIARALGVSYDTARQRVEQMEQMGWIYRNGQAPAIELRGTSCTETI